MHESRKELLLASKTVVKPGVIELMMLGLMFRTHRMVPEAEQAFMHGLEISPDHGPLLSNYAVLLMQLGRMEEAEQRFISAVKNLPEDPAPYLNLARIYLVQKRFEEVEKVLEKVKDTDPAHPDFAVCQGMLARHDGDIEAAHNGCDYKNSKSSSSLARVAEYSTRVC
jgi:Flp pilus assembly protein TadD